MMPDPFDIPVFLRRMEGTRPYTPRKRQLRVGVVNEALPQSWQGARRALVHVVARPYGEYPAEFPCGRRSVYYMERPRKGTVRVRAVLTGDVAEISRAAFERSLVKPLEDL